MQPTALKVIVLEKRGLIGKTLHHHDESVARPRTSTWRPTVDFTSLGTSVVFSWGVAGDRVKLSLRSLQQLEALVLN